MDTFGNGRSDDSAARCHGARMLILEPGLRHSWRYELLIKPNWQESGDLVVRPVDSPRRDCDEPLAICVALFGMSQHIRFDAASRGLTYSYKTAGGRHGEKQYPFSDIEALRVRTHHWSEGPATYNLALKLRATREIEFGRFVVEGDAERYLSVLTGMIEH